ncbi:putative MFS family arabinose efflux permease [Kitasatospora viridis]|uniref:Putative MFS family arabinose efflux permease n=1 Tax=Kitasatospora viridis TaxID=281105 RepID=A0A561UDW6_9ACTN|nr:putative MFS family arabinose efflux permease [Kitasatospora viridis]
MLSSYRQIFAAPGSLAFSATGLVSRLPISMVGVGVVTMFSELRGSYGLAGAITATLALASAALGPQISRLVDRYGQRRVVRPATAVSVLAAALLLLAAWRSWPTWSYFPCAIGMGAMGSTGALVRARWALLYRDDPEKLHTAYSLEAVVDEIIFIVGPILSICLATSVFPEAGVLLATVFLAVGVVLFTAQKRTEPPAHPANRATGGSVLRLPGLRVLTATFVAIGTIFSSVEVVTVAYARAQGHESAASLVLAVYALGSGLAGVVVGALRPSGPARQRFQRGVALMAISLLPLCLVATWCSGTGGLVLAGASLFLAGFSISPTMITATGLVERLVPPARLTEGMSWTTTGLGIGVAGGSYLAGVVVDAAGPAAGYRVALAAGGCAVLLALAGGRWLVGALPASTPEPAAVAS